MRCIKIAHWSSNRKMRGKINIINYIYCNTNVMTALKKIGMNKFLPKHMIYLT